MEFLFSLTPKPHSEWLLDKGRVGDSLKTYIDASGLETIGFADVKATCDKLHTQCSAITYAIPIKLDS